MGSLLKEPALAVTGFGVEAVAVVDTKTFLRDPTDADTDVIFTGGRGFDAAGELVRVDAWELTNDPTITAITTDQPTNTEIRLTGTTTLTILGNTFGAAVGDIQVIAHVLPADTANGPAPYNRKRIADNRMPVATVITASANLDDAAPPGNASITATIVMPRKWGAKNAAVGAVEISVHNTKRMLVSERFTGLTVEI